MSSLLQANLLNLKINDIRGVIHAPGKGYRSVMFGDGHAPAGQRPFPRIAGRRFGANGAGRPSGHPAAEA
jgi:hypothetical protein